MDPITFQLRVRNAKANESFILSGSIKELGNFNPSQSIQLIKTKEYVSSEYKGDTISEWEPEEPIYLDRQISFQYGYGLMEDNVFSRWEFGNRRCSHTFNSANQIAISDVFELVDNDPFSLDDDKPELSKFMAGDFDRKRKLFLVQYELPVILKKLPGSNDWTATWVEDAILARTPNSIAQDMNTLWVGVVTRHCFDNNTWDRYAEHNFSSETPPTVKSEFVDSSFNVPTSPILGGSSVIQNVLYAAPVEGAISMIDSKNKVPDIIAIDGFGRRPGSVEGAGPVCSTIDASGVRVPDSEFAYSRFVLSSNDMTSISKALNKMDIIPIFLPTDLHTQYFNYCHSVLKPAICNVLETGSQAIFPKASSLSYQTMGWKAYQIANETVSRVVMSQHSPNDIVWTNDFYLMLLPRYIAKEGLRVHGVRPPQAFFFHSPFPTSEIFRTLFIRDELLEAVIECDVVGFHTFNYARHFLHACKRLLGITFRSRRGGSLALDVDGRDVLVNISHVGVESMTLDRWMHSPEAAAAAAEIHSKYPKKLKIIGIDSCQRLAGVALKLLAFERLLEDYPSYRDRLVFVQRCELQGALREDIEHVSDELRGRIAQINATYGPVIDYAESVAFSPQYRVGLLHQADVLLQTPIREGLNLLPLEYIYLRTKWLLGSSADVLEAPARRNSDIMADSHTGGGGTGPQPTQNDLNDAVWSAARGRGSSGALEKGLSNLQNPKFNFSSLDRASGMAFVSQFLQQQQQQQQSQQLGVSGPELNQQLDVQLGRSAAQGPYATISSPHELKKSIFSVFPGLQSPANTCNPLSAPSTPTSADVFRGGVLPPPTRGGTILLSEFSAATSVLNSNFVVNPWNVRAVAIEIDKALSMLEGDRLFRQWRDFSYCIRKPASQWSRSLVADVVEQRNADVMNIRRNSANTNELNLSSTAAQSGLHVAAELERSPVPALDPSGVASALKKSQGRKLIVFDYGGTLVSRNNVRTGRSSFQVDGYAQSVPPAVLRALARIAARDDVLLYVVSGLRSATIDGLRLSRCPSIGLASENGMYVTHPVLGTTSTTGAFLYPTSSSEDKENKSDLKVSSPHDEKRDKDDKLTGDVVGVGLSEVFGVPEDSPSLVSPSFATSALPTDLHGTILSPKTFNASSSSLSSSETSSFSASQATEQPLTLQVPKTVLETGSGEVEGETDSPATTISYTLSLSPTPTPTPTSTPIATSAVESGTERENEARKRSALASNADDLSKFSEEHALGDDESFEFEGFHSGAAHGVRPVSHRDWSTLNAEVADKLAEWNLVKHRAIAIATDYAWRVNGSVVREYDSLVAWDFRGADAEWAQAQSRFVASDMEALAAELGKQDDVKVVIRKSRVEVSLKGLSKGNLVMDVLDRFPGVDFVLCVGDDTTDEEMFLALSDAAKKSLSSGETSIDTVTCTVGKKSSTTAKFFCPGVNTVHSLILQMEEVLCPPLNK